MNLYQDVFFRSLDLLRGRNTIQRLHSLRQSQHWNTEQIAVYQLKRLNALLLQAKNNSPFYQSRLADLKLPLSSLAELCNIPIITKTDIRQNQQRIRCTNIPDNRFVESRTGGSTGEPMFYFWDKQGMDWNRASVYRSAEWANTALGERSVLMSGSNYDYTQAKSVQNKIVYFLHRHRHFTVVYLDKEIMERYYQQLLEFRPTSIWGYSSGLAVFSDFINEHHPATDFSFIKAIMTSSEMLWPEQRNRINQAFGGNKVFDQYGSRELYIAAECKVHNGYHVHAEVILAEIVDPNGNACKPGETGRVVLTDLTNQAFPFIRYENGDLGVMEEPGQCECGMWLPRIRSVQGRIADVIVLKDRILTAPSFSILFSDKRGIKAYQIRQDKIDEIEVVMVPDENYSADFEHYIRTAIESMVAGQATVKTTLQDEIKVPESGKRRFIVSNVSHNYF